MILVSPAVGCEGVTGSEKSFKGVCLIIDAEREGRKERKGNQFVLHAEEVTRL